MTESYGSRRDPPEKDVPFCTLKSFPNQIQHTIQWARDKFANLFSLKPQELNKLLAENDVIEVPRAPFYLFIYLIIIVYKLLAKCTGIANAARQ
jgi:hypothetical protein